MVLKSYIIIVFTLFLWSCSDNETKKKPTTVVESTLSELNADGNSSSEDKTAVSADSAISNEAVPAVVVKDCESGGTAFMALPELMIDSRIPVFNVAQTAKASLPSLSEEALAALSTNTAKEVTISLCLQLGDAAPTVVSTLDPMSLTTTASTHDLEWQSAQLGEAKLWATFKLDDYTVMKTAPLVIFTHHKKLHFFHETPNDNQKWITSGVYDAELTEEQSYGIKMITKVAGSSEDDADTLTNQQWSDTWQSALQADFSGILIDSFEDNDTINDTMGSAIDLFKQNQAEQFIVTYSDGVSGTDMTTGLGLADLSVVKQSVTSWRDYGKMDRYDQLVDANLASQSVLGVDLSKASQTHEIRQQIAYIRTQYPAMPGVAFFNAAPSSRAWKAIDQAIYDYYFGPAVLLKVEAEVYSVHNLGALSASNVVVNFLDADSNQVSQETISVITGGQLAEITLPEGADSAELDRGDYDYTVVNFLAPNEVAAYTDAEMLDAQSWFEGQKQYKDIAKPFEGSPALNLINDEESGHLQQATFPVTGFEDDAQVTMSFDIKSVAAWFYASNRIRLGNDNSFMQIRLFKQDSDTDVPNGQLRYHFIYSGPNGTTTYTTAPVIARDIIITVVMHYDPETQVIRNLLFDGDTLLSDTGYIEIDGPYSFDKLSVLPNTDPDSIIEWLEGDDIIDQLRIFSHCCGVSSYKLDSHISNVQIFGKKTEE